MEYNNIYIKKSDGKYYRLIHPSDYAKQVNKTLEALRQARKYRKDKQEPPSDNIIKIGAGAYIIDDVPDN